MRGFLIIAGFFAVYLLLILSGSCCKPEEAKALLESQGFTQVEITGYRWLMCSEDDAFSDGFVAISAAGQRVSGAVCRGFFKGSTIRFDGAE